MSFFCAHDDRCRAFGQTPDGVVASSCNLCDRSRRGVREVDWVLVATKAYDVAGAAKWLERLCQKRRRRWLCCRTASSIENVLRLMCRWRRFCRSWSTVRRAAGPGEVRQRGMMHLKVPDSVLGRDFVGLFAGTSADATVVPDFLSVVWRKLCFNSAGVLSALVMKPAGVVREESDGRGSAEDHSRVRRGGAGGRSTTGRECGRLCWRPSALLRRIRSTPCWPTGRRDGRWRSTRGMA